MSQQKDILLEIIDHEEIISIAKKLISIPSFTGHEKNVALYIHDLLENNGIDSSLIEIEPNRPQVIACIHGTGGGKSLLLNGHMDIDTLQASWGNKDPFDPWIEGNKLWGAGIHNMKSGVAAIIGAALAIVRSKVSLSGDIHLAFVVGELQGGVGTRKLLESGFRADYGIIPEPYSVQNILTKCVGVHKFSITIAKQISSKYESKEGVCSETLKKMDELRKILEGLKYGPTLNDFPGVPRLLIGSIIGGRNETQSKIIDECTIFADLRYAGDIDSVHIDTIILSALEKLQTGLFDYKYNHPPKELSDVSYLQQIKTVRDFDNSLSITTKGVSVHTSRSEEGIDAIKQMDIIKKTLDSMSSNLNLNFILRAQIGGRGPEHDLTGPTHVADRCTLLIEAHPKYKDPQALKDLIEKELQAQKHIVNDYELSYPASFITPSNLSDTIGGVDMPPMNFPPNMELVEYIKLNYEYATGGRKIQKVGAVAPYSYCGNDTGHLQTFNIPCCLFGPRGYSDDTERHVRIDEMIDCTRTLALTACNLCQ